MLIALELIFIFILAAVLIMIFKTDGISLRNRLRQARLEKCWSGKDRRQHPRFPQSLTVVYSVTKKQPPASSGAKTKDVSEGGIRLVLDEKLPIGAYINLKISLPDSTQPAEVSGNVIWTEDAPDIKEPSGKRFFYSGIKFSSIKEPSGSYLIGYIRSIAQEKES